MPVQNDPLQISPYTSTVPLLQIPPQAIEQQTRPAGPLEGQFGGHKGTGALAIGDSLLKGFMMGHQQKEAKKQAQAQATINAADAASEAAYTEYQNALTKAGGKQDDPAAQAAYQAYTTAFQAGKQAKSQFVMPDKTQKGKKNATDSDPVKSPDDKKKKGAASAGFNNIKDFFAANPHIIPQIALITMQPKPPGLTPQAQVQNLELQTAQSQNQEQQQKVNDRNMLAMYGKMTPEEIAKLPPEVQKQINDPQNGLATARNRYAMENRDKTKPDWFVDEAGNFHQIAVGEEPPPGWKKYEKTPTNESQSNMYYDAAARAWGTTRDKLSVQQLEYVDAMRARSKAQSSGQTTYSYSTTDTSGNRSTTTRKVSDPIKTPAGVSPLPEKVFGEPPAASQQSSPGSGPITPPPAAKAAPAAQSVPPTAPKGSTQFTVGAKPKGMVEEGNLPIWNRPTVQNAGGDHSSEYSTSFEQDGKEVLVPTVVNGKFLTPDGKKPKPGSPEEKAMFEAARKHYEETGENLGKFANSKDADAYANTLHSRGEKKAGAKGPITAPPQAGKTAKAGSQTGITPPPGGKQTATTAQVTRQAVTKQKEDYRKAEAQYQKDITDADIQFAKAQKASVSSNDPSILQTAQEAKDSAYSRAKSFLEDAKRSIAEEYDAAVASIGGTPGSQSGSTAENPPPGATARVKDANGKLIGYAVNGQFVPLGK
jgi:hypothetical protein